MTCLCLNSRSRCCFWALIPAGLAQGEGRTGHAEAKESRQLLVAPSSVPLGKPVAKTLASNQREHRPAFWALLLKMNRQAMMLRQQVHVSGFLSMGRCRS